MKPAPACVVLVLTACTPVASGADDVIALELRTPASISLVVGDTVVLEAVALTARGTEAIDAQIVWTVLDVDSGQVGFSLDTLTGEVIALTPGDPTRVQARVETLRSDALTIAVSDPIPFRREDRP